jgi:hypothetical protein
VFIDFQEGSHVVPSIVLQECANTGTPETDVTYLQSEASCSGGVTSAENVFHVLQLGISCDLGDGFSFYYFDYYLEFTLNRKRIIQKLLNCIQCRSSNLQALPRAINLDISMLMVNLTASDTAAPRAQNLHLGHRQTKQLILSLWAPRRKIIGTMSKANTASRRRCHPLRLLHRLQQLRRQRCHRL